LFGEPGAFPPCKTGTPSHIEHDDIDMTRVSPAVEAGTVHTRQPVNGD
jgi:hypothetical protein